MGALVVSGCSTLPDLPPDLARQIRIEQVPYFAQEENQCGPASLAMVLNYRGLEVSPDELTASLYIPEKEGTLAIEIQARARQFGLLSYNLDSELNALLEEIEAGNPVIVMQNLGFTWAPQWHFAVAFGYDLKEKEILLRSGPNREYRLDLALFDRTWRRADRWALVVTPPTQLPTSASPLKAAQSANQLEQSGFLDEASSAYLAILDRWHDDSLALFGLGNIAYQQGHYDDARNYLRRRAELFPLTAETWNNLAYAELASGCGDNAEIAAQCAVSLQPNEPGFIDSLSEVAGEENSTDFCSPLPSCPGNHDAAKLPD